MGRQLRQSAAERFLNSANYIVFSHNTPPVPIFQSLWDAKLKDRNLILCPHVFLQGMAPNFDCFIPFMTPGHNDGFRWMRVNGKHDITVTIPWRFGPFPSVQDPKERRLSLMGCIYVPDVDVVILTATHNSSRWDTAVGTGAFGKWVACP